jgi:hypothetical protein
MNVVPRFGDEAALRAFGDEWTSLVGIQMTVGV